MTDELLISWHKQSGREKTINLTAHQKLTDNGVPTTATNYKIQQVLTQHQLTVAPWITTAQLLQQQQQHQQQTRTTTYNSTPAGLSTTPSGAASHPFDDSYLYLKTSFRQIKQDYVRCCVSLDERHAAAAPLLAASSVCLSVCLSVIKEICSWLPPFC